MKITKDEIMELSELLSEAESFRPLVRMVLDALKSYSGELREIPEAMSRWFVENRIRAINQYKAAGFDQDDAILMTLDDIYGIRKLSDKAGKSAKK